jgi:HTH-type transcriptional regulator/antitoxin HigA
MDIRAINTDADYEWALKEVEKYFNNVPSSGTPEAERFDVLSALIESYESHRFDRPNSDPIEVLHFAMESMGKTQAELGHLITRSRATEIMNRKRRLTLAMIRIISEAWRIPIAALAQPYKTDEDHQPNARRQRQVA